MNQLNWEDMELTTKTSPAISDKLLDFVSMKGALNVFVRRNKSLSSEVYENSSAIYEIMKQSFPKLKFVGEENINETKEDCPRYLGQI